MQLIKTLLIVAVLAAVTYGVYAALTGARDVPPPPGAPSEDLSGAPQIELPPVDVSAPSGPPARLVAPNGPAATPQIVSPGGVGEAPPYTPPGDNHGGGTAPPYVAPNVGPGDPAPGRGALPPADAAPPAATAYPGNAAIPPGSGYDAPPPQEQPGSYDAALPVGPGAPIPVEGGANPGAVPPAVDVHAPPATGTAPAADVPPMGTAPPAGTVPPPGAGAAPATSPDDDAAYRADYDKAQALLQERRLDDALKVLSQWYCHPSLGPQEQQGLLELLYQLAGTVIYSREHLLVEGYEIQPGDTLDQIAQRYHVPWQVLAKINGVQDPNALRAGDRLKVLPGPFHAVVDLRTKYLTLFLGPRFAGRFPIGLGVDQPAPEGDFAVRDKTTNPPYYGRDRVIDSSDPSNPLGKYWIGLGNQFGIHGTNDPQNLARPDAKGCILMSSRDIEDVYDMMTVESRVRILR